MNIPTPPQYTVAAFFVLNLHVFKKIVLFAVYLSMESIKDLITIDSETLGGKAVFKGTRVPVESLFDHLEMGISLNEFLDDFPTVGREQAVKILEIAEKLITSKNIADLYEAAA
ncbi:hypothetical protein BH09BAC1_BH09BAC1_13690 [soil metagenome]